MTTVLVTGFGPFRDIKVNASWEAVKLLPSYKIDGVQIVAEEIPVTYKDVDEKIPKLWNELNPKLVVHVGVHSRCNVIRLESKGNRTGYTQEDCTLCLHPTAEVCCAKEGDDCIKTQIDLKKLCKTVNSKVKGKVEISDDAGRYLCEYTYYTSLKIDCKRTLFVHVPPLDSPYSARELADTLVQVIISSLDSLNEFNE